MRKGLYHFYSEFRFNSEPQMQSEHEIRDFLHQIRVFLDSEHDFSGFSNLILTMLRDSSMSPKTSFIQRSKRLTVLTAIG
jgi:hypothetical protein